MQPKKKLAQRNEAAGTSLAEKARRAERAWRAASAAAADLPPAEPRRSRDETKAMDQIAQQAGGGEFTGRRSSAAAAADKRRTDALEAERLRERTRRRKPHVPVGLTTAAAGDRVLVFRSPPRDFERSTPALAHDAAALVQIFTTVGTKPMRAVVARAIRAASAELRSAWVGHLVYAISVATAARLARELNPRMARELTNPSPASVRRAAARELEAYAGLATFPAWVDEPLIEWLLAHFTPGELRANGKVRGAGGRSGKWTEEGLAELLRSPKKLAEALDHHRKRTLAANVRRN